MKHLLVTNDFPPKLGGIQSYLWELWRRLPPDQFGVLTSPYEGAARWDADQSFSIVRTRQKVLLPTRALAREIKKEADQIGAEMVILDPALPVGALGPHLERPYGLVLHGAEVTVPGRLPLSRQLLARVLNGAERVIAAGGYPAAEAERAAGRRLPITVVPPGVDVDRFRPLNTDQRNKARAEFGLAEDAFVILGLSRLVPRKGFDVVIKAAARLRMAYPQLRLVIGGTGRDAQRLQRVADSHGAPVRFFGRVDDDALPRLYGCVDLFAMVCRGNRWGGLEQEGFGIVFLEAAAAGIPQIAGRSGGSHEAVESGHTGLVVDDPSNIGAVATAIAAMIEDPDRRQTMGEAARERVAGQFTYDVLAARLAKSLDMEAAL